jgi:hypothetical protein
MGGCGWWSSSFTVDAEVLMCAEVVVGGWVGGVRWSLML